MEMRQCDCARARASLEWSKLAAKPGEHAASEVGRQGGWVAGSDIGGKRLDYTMAGKVALKHRTALWSFKRLF